jgi:hypothetical protein
MGTRSPFLYGSSFAVEGLDTAFAIDDSDAERSARHESDGHESRGDGSSMLADGRRCDFRRKSVGHDMMRSKLVVQ